MKRILIFLLLLASIAEATAQSQIIHPKEKIQLDNGQLRDDVRYYVYHTHQLPRRDSTQFWGWISGWADFEKLPTYQLVGRDTLVLELMIEHYFWYDRYRDKLVGHRYVPYDDYPADLSRGEVKWILNRLQKLEKKP